ncbi:uncharacterized protein L201_001577 [Kwoniella dendrophila CBS 6074]|uniref:Uncharacterized protein n=1 Tax=Kwoniella dendrophila CBS 6074 TaxID=1295534 RepID=A0AAX4JQ70_9TREE
MPSSFLPPYTSLQASTMRPFGKPPSSSNSAQPTSANGSTATSPNIPTSHLGSTSAAGSRNGTPASTPGGGSGLRPSYGLMSERDRDRDKLTEITKPYSTHTLHSHRPSDASSAHHHHHHSGTPGSNPPSAGSTPREERPNTYTSASNPLNGGAAAARKPMPVPVSGFGSGSNLGRLASGYGLFGSSPFREQEMREKERQERLAKERDIQRERERSTKPLSVDTSPTHRNSASANPYSRPSLPPSPTTSRTLAVPNSASSTGRPSVSPQITPASASSATSSTPRPNLPLPGYGSLGSRSLPSPFERERSASASVAPSPHGHLTAESGHRRTPSGSGARINEPANAAGPKSPVKSTAQTAASARSLYGAPPSLNEAARNREAQRSPVAVTQTTIPPRDRDAAVSPTAATGTASKQSAAGSNAPPANNTPSGSQSTRAPYNSYSGFGGGGYPGTFGGFGLGGFPGYGAFGPRWGDRERERETVEAREKREEEKRRKEKELAESKAKADKEREEQQRAKWRAAEAEERKSSINHHPRAFRPTTGPTQPAPAASSDPYRRDPPADHGPADKPNNTRHIEVIHQPDKREPNGTTAGSSVIQQVAPTREPRPYGYKSESREYQYTPRDKRPRMDAAVEDAQNAHRRTSNAKASKRRKEEEKKAEVNNTLTKETDYAALTNPSRKWPEVSSSQVEQWLKTVPDLNQIISNEVYTGEHWTLSKSEQCKIENEGGLINVRIGGGFLGKNWKVRGEQGWDDSSCTPSTSNGNLIGDSVIFKDRKIWGTDVYTDDSDLGLILIHAGWLRWSSSSSSNERDKDIINVTIRLVPRLIRYTATERNGIKTRGWGNGHDGSSIVVERVERIAINKTYLKSRKRKVRMSEWVQERQIVAPVLISVPHDDDEDATLVQDDQDHDGSLMFCSRIKDKTIKTAKAEAGLVYTPEAFKNWLDPPETGHEWTLWQSGVEFSGSDQDNAVK